MKIINNTECIKEFIELLLLSVIVETQYFASLQNKCLCYSYQTLLFLPVENVLAENNK